MNREIEIPKGYEARINGNKVILEPKDSEDERIRKELWEYFHELELKSDRDFSPSFTIDDILAWLEKQKEENHDGKKWLTPEQLHRIEQLRYEAGFDAGVRSEMKKRKEQEAISFSEPYNPDDYEVVMEGNATGLKKKRKPAEWDELQSEFKNINEAFEDGKKEVVAHPEKYGLCDCEPKPEWGEEDEDNLRRVTRIIEDNDSDWKELTAWLKSLRPQPKQEWNEEDEKCIKDIINCLKYLEAEDTERQYNGDKNVNPKRYADMIAKLESLCPQPHWKPSEEQMEALKNSAYGAYQNGDGSVLRGLYEQLKKLI